MRCQRCQGLLVSETFGGLNIEANALCLATRCINCGCVEDVVVRSNRFCRSEKTREVPRRKARTGDVVFNPVQMKGQAVLR
jgi:hypothetical protein